MKKLRTCALLLLAVAALTLLAGCGAKKEAPHADLNALYEQLSAMPETVELNPLSEKRIRNYYGIDPAACPQLILAQSTDALRADEIWLIEAADEESAEALLKLANSRVEQLGGEMRDYLPEQYAIVQKAEVLRIGNSVGLFISPVSDAMAGMFRQAFEG